MEDIEQAKQIIVYLISSPLGNMVYAGSTNRTLDIRYSDHISNYKSYKNSKANYLSSFKLFEKYGIENCKIEPILTKVCTKIERYMLENVYIKKYKGDKLYDCVNEKMAYREPRLKGGIAGNPNTSGVVGVHFNVTTQMWRAKIGKDGRRYESPYSFEKFEDAVNWRFAKQEELFGKGMTPFNKPITIIIKPIIKPIIIGDNNTINITLPTINIKSELDLLEEEFLKLF